MPKSPQGETDPTNPRVDDIRWLEAALFSSEARVFSSGRGTPALDEPVAWTALPLRGTTRRLVPTAARFAARAFANDHDAMPPSRRMLGRAARLAARSGALRFAPQVRADASVVFADPTQSVIAAAANALGQSVTSCAITLGPQRYNRKPVVQLMNDAETVGFLKVGADEMTSMMVGAEARVVEQLRRPTESPLTVPQVLWRSEWQGRSVACFSPVAPVGNTLVPADEVRLVETARAVVDAGGERRSVELRDCVLLKRVQHAAKLVDRPDVADLVDRAVATRGLRTVSVGQWHGDFSPWNMMSTQQSTALIDWEFADPEMPVGADLLHHRLMVATHLRGESAQRPLQQLLGLDDAIPELRSMDVPADQHRLHLLLYAFELVRRDLELLHANRPSTGFATPALSAANAILAKAD